MCKAGAGCIQKQRTRSSRLTLPNVYVESVCKSYNFNCNITPSLRTFPYCSNLRQFSTRFIIVRKRGSRHSHRKVSFTHYATALCAPGVANKTAQSLVLRTRGLPHGKNKRTCACISKMKAKFFAVWEEEYKEPRRTTATCCG